MITPILFSIGSLNISTFGLILFCGLILSSFIFFKNTQNELADNDLVISLTIYITLGWFLGARLFFYLTHFKDFPNISSLFLPWHYPGLSFCGGIAGTIIAIILVTKMMKIDFWHLSDSLLFPLLINNFFFLLGQFLVGQQIFLLYDLAAVLIATGIGHWFLRHYRSLAWYPSGKIGLAFLLTNAIFLLLLDILAIFSINDLYLLEQVTNLTLTLVAVMIGYRRSGRNASKDFWFFKKLIKLALRDPHEQKK